MVKTGSVNTLAASKKRLAGEFPVIPDEGS